MVNFNMPLNKLIDALRETGKTYDELCDEYDLESQDYSHAEQEYKNIVANMPDQRKCEERQTVQDECMRCVEMLEPFNENEAVNEWMYRAVTKKSNEAVEKSDAVVNAENAYAAELIALGILCSKMSILCRLAPDDMFAKYNASIN